MRSIGARLTFWYALSATLTFAVLFLAGYTLLETRMIRGLDALNAAEFRQLKQHLGVDYRKLDSRMMDQRIREMSESGSTLFYVSVGACQEFRVWPGIMGKKENPDACTQEAYDT